VSDEPEEGTETVGDGTLELDLPAAHSAARMARHLIRPFARSGGVVGGELDNLLLVAAELLSNAVDHGGGGGAVHEPGDEGARMRLALRVAGGSWRLEVSDEGGGDAATVRELIQPNGLPDLEDERGRGFFLIGQMVDEIGVQATSDGRGLTLRCVRRLPG
jgi:anti-sigma regulatory factor (Ser/Thr protein kinase)